MKSVYHSGGFRIVTPGLPAWLSEGWTGMGHHNEEGSCEKTASHPATATRFGCACEVVPPRDPESTPDSDAVNAPVNRVFAFRSSDPAQIEELTPLYKNIEKPQPPTKWREVMTISVSGLGVKCINRGHTLTPAKSQSYVRFWSPYAAVRSLLGHFGLYRTGINTISLEPLPV